MNSILFYHNTLCKLFPTENNNPTIVHNTFLIVKINNSHTIDQFIVGFRRGEKHRLQRVKIAFVGSEDKMRQTCHVLPSIYIM